jgi:hypothetical protein
MLVKCIRNSVSTLASDEASARTKAWTNSEGKYADLEIDKIYPVEAIEYIDNGIFYYLHSVDASEHPYPYASEFFGIENSSLPESWDLSLRAESGLTRLKRLTFPEWANDDLFFEKLVDGDPECVAIYATLRQS